MTDQEQRTYRCPIDGAELKPGQACKEHGIAFADDGQDGRVVARAHPMTRRNSPARLSTSDAPAPAAAKATRRRKATSS